MVTVETAIIHIELATMKIASAVLAATLLESVVGFSTPRPSVRTATVAKLVRQPPPKRTTITEMAFSSPYSLSVYRLSTILPGLPQIPNVTKSMDPSTNTAPISIASPVVRLVL